ncbi:MAG: nitroreductase family protein [Actinomycetota bacterium]
MDFETVVMQRRMVRNYSDAPVTEDQIERIMRVARRTPSAGFSQGQSFVVVTDPSTRARIAELAGEPNYVEQGFDPWISGAPVVVVCCTSEKLYRDRYLEPDKLRGDGTPIEWPVPYWWVDSGCSMMLLLLAAVNEGLAAGFLGMGAEGYQHLKEVLEIPNHVTPFGLVTIGHPVPDRRSGSLARGWRPDYEVVHRERWGE